jgi:hypothetical protein
MQRKWAILHCFCMENRKWKCFIFSASVVRATAMCLVRSVSFLRWNRNAGRCMILCAPVLMRGWWRYGDMCRHFAVSIRKAKWSWIVDGLAQVRVKVAESWDADWRATHWSGEVPCVSDCVLGRVTYVDSYKYLLPFCLEPSVFQFDTPSPARPQKGDQKVCVHLMVTIQKVTGNVQSVPHKSPDIYWHAELCSRRPCSV